MKTRTPLLIACLAGYGLVGSNVHAQDTTTPPVGPYGAGASDIVPEALISEPVYSDIELGIGYVSDDAYFFGRYNGLQTRGAYLVGDIDAEKFDEDGRFWSVRGTNLGLESRYLRLEGGEQGRHKFFLEWDELPNYMSNTGFTPFLGVGGDNLSLPSGFDINSNLDASLNPLEVQTKRERIKAGAGFVMKQRWQLDVDFSHEVKEGVEVIGGPMLTATNQILAFTTTSLLPEPVKHDTSLVNAILNYAGDEVQVDLKYHASFFDNNYASLTWQDPFNPTTGVGSLALAPDNEFHQLSLTSTFSLPYKSRLTGVASVGRMTQDQKFQPYSVGGSISALPSESLDGEVWLLNGQLKLASRPTQKLRLNADLRYDERDNQTPKQIFSYVRLDTGGAGGQANNNPYSQENLRLNIGANYRLNAISSLRGEYTFDKKDRSRFDAGREDTDEHALFAKLKIKPHAIVDFELYGEKGRRDGSDFIFEPGTYQDSLMRKYNVADRDRTKVGGLINVMATDRLFRGARADYSKDEYTDTQLGLTEASQPTVTLDFTYTPVANLSTYGYYTWENIESSQNGNDVSSDTGPTGGIPTPGPWQADFDDTFDTIGVGGKWTGLGKWDLGGDVAYSKAIGKIEMSHADPNIVDQFPNNKTEMISIKLYTDYHYSKQLTYKLAYWYEEYVADNWAVDNLDPYDPNVVANTLLLGNTTMDYEVSVIAVSASYRFK